MIEKIETIKIKRKRLLFRSGHRGTKEMDILLGGFYEANMLRFSEDQLNEFEDLLEIPDDDLYGWAMGRMDIPVEFDTQLLRDFIESVQSRGAGKSL
ncbi:MAG: succinate dehydrogenase assembly factor 2 [Pseudomonadota bacterium]|nr:succinate dehydrogenase assembly factor 2 [Pseudomonadota bacterium]